MTEHTITITWWAPKTYMQPEELEADCSCDDWDWWHDDLLESQMDQKERTQTHYREEWD